MFAASVFNKYLYAVFCYGSKTFDDISLLSYFVSFITHTCGHTKILVAYEVHITSDTLLVFILVSMWKGYMLAFFRSFLRVSACS